MTDRNSRPTHFDVVHALTGESRPEEELGAGASRREIALAVASLGFVAGVLVAAGVGIREEGAAGIGAAAIGGALLIGSLAREIGERDLRGVWRWIPFLGVPFLFDRPASLAGLVAVRQLVMVGRAFLRHRTGRAAVEYLWSRPVSLLAAGFALTILFGTILLMLPFASAAGGRGLTFVDALFTATSAVCVTGLTVVDTATALSPAGQGILALLIQAGGLGVMTLSTLAAVVVGRRLGFARTGAIAAATETVAPTDAIRIVRLVVRATLIAEGLGAAVLTLAFLPDMPFLRALWLGAFHAVSAFCNAGFALWTDNLVSWGTSPAVVVTIGILVVVGGLGFLVLGELYEWLRRRDRRGRPLTLHTRIVLVTTGVLILSGAILYLLLEWHGSLEGLDAPGKALGAVFMSVTTRTAGFNTVPMGGLESATILVFLVLMFVGASPGSTGGGIKTTTAGVLLLSVRAYLRGGAEVEVGGRAVPGAIVVRAVALAALAVLVVLTGLFLLLATQDGSFQSLLFEAVSAFGTVGLSIGATAELDASGKLILVAMMYVGRIGPLTLVLLLGAGTRRAAVRYPEEPVALT